MSTETKTIKNPRNFIYPEGTKVEIDGYLLESLILLTENLMNSEIKSESRYKFKYVKEDGAQVKTPKQTDIDSGKVKKILDMDRTITNPTMEYSITQKGIEYAELKNFLESYHYDNILSGKAVDYTLVKESQS